MSKDLNFESLGKPLCVEPGRANGKECTFDCWAVCTITAPEKDFFMARVEYHPEIGKHVLVIARETKKV